MKYRTIVIDPPWPVKPISQNYSKPFRAGSPIHDGLPYRDMTLEDIYRFQIDDFADTNCILFTWTTNAYLRVAMDIMDWWRFKYSATLTWHKNTGINMHGMFGNSEYVIVGYRGNFNRSRNFRCSMPACFAYDTETHSRKPAGFYRRLLSFTHEPRIDIFARRRHHGFDAWGDQVEKAPATLQDFNTVEMNSST